jgi:hypothetical protein
VTKRAAAKAAELVVAAEVAAAAEEEVAEEVAAAEVAAAAADKVTFRGRPHRIREHQGNPVSTATRANHKRRRT